ncbi:MAG TPA: zf-HC2 domain-containing protein [Bryobacteraceae bacterium]|jgi:anti-sigma factor RsiW|nr:zf-HC2 domain-containing protein [Bryobacteraceae bacterium]
MTNCLEVDLKAFLLGEADDGERERISGHLASCAECREEMERLRLTHMALGALRDEEPPRRIAFVSDKIFEPKWWQRWLTPGPVAGFASAAVLALAIVAHGEMSKPKVPPAPAVSAAEIEQNLQNSFDRKLQAAIAKAVADVRQQDKRETAELLEAAGKRFSEQRRMDLAAFEVNYENLYKRTALERKLAYSSQQLSPTDGVSR